MEFKERYEEKRLSEWNIIIKKRIVCVLDLLE